MDKNHIKEYWELQARNHGSSHWASWGDEWMINLEIETISKYLKHEDCVLDIGCGNGYSTLKQAQLHKLKKIFGVDFATNMVTEAEKSKQYSSWDCEIEFELGDIRSLRYADNTFDVVYTTRVLINLPTWNQQMAGISECIRVAKKGGLIILSEGFWEPLVTLNAIRLLKNLPPLVEHDFNRYLKMCELEKFLNNLGLSYIVNDFSSIYYLGSRFLRELVTDPSAYPGFTNPINEIFFDIQKKFSGGGVGIQQAFVITKN